MARKGSEKRNSGKENKRDDDISGKYKCKYCEYHTTQDWILLRHLSAVHDEKCDCQTICSQCNNKDVLRIPYQRNSCLRTYV